MLKHKRQMSPTIDGIRDDHVARYRFAVDRLKALGGIEEVTDLGCGCGYGSWILGEDGRFGVEGIDLDQGAIDYAREHYSSWYAHFSCKAVGHGGASNLYEDIVLYDASKPLRHHAFTAFEVIEHVPDAPDLLKRMAACGWALIGSVPNQATIPFDAAKHPWHARHYTPGELRDTLEAAGWEVTFMGGQRGKRGVQAKVIADPAGCRTIVFTARSQ